MFDSPDADTLVAAAAVTSAGAVIGPDTVAALVVQAIADRTFLVLPHPEVLTMYRQKGADYKRWIAGMRRYQRPLGCTPPLAGGALLANLTCESTPPHLRKPHMTT